jgi:hypothetical protein
MGQSSYVYILWLVILAAGLWIIIGYGSLLHAREDLAGEWQITPEDPASATDTQRMKVEQSGQYFNITLPERQPLRLKMVEETLVGQPFIDSKRITLHGEGVTATFEGRSQRDLWRFSLDGHTKGAYVARLAERLYSRPSPTTQKASLSPAHAR